MDIHDYIIEVMEKGKGPKKVAGEVTWMFRSSLPSVCGRDVLLK